MPALVAQRLGDGLAKHDAAVFGGMVEIDMQVALGAQGRCRSAHAVPTAPACDRENRRRSRYRARPSPRDRPQRGSRSRWFCARWLPVGLSIRHRLSALWFRLAPLCAASCVRFTLRLSAEPRMRQFGRRECGFSWGLPIFSKGGAGWQTRKRRQSGMAPPF